MDINGRKLVVYMDKVCQRRHNPPEIRVDCENTGFFKRNMIDKNFQEIRLAACSKLDTVASGFISPTGFP